MKLSEVATAPSSFALVCCFAVIGADLARKTLLKQLKICNSQIMPNETFKIYATFNQNHELDYSVHNSSSSGYFLFLIT